MPIYGQFPTQSLYPGSVGKLLGVNAVPGTPITAANETLPAHTATSVIVVAARPGDHASTQRQITWRIFGSTSGIQLQASIDEVAANYVTIDTSAGSPSTEIRVVQADNSSTAGPGLQSALKIVSSARFFRVLNNNGSPFTGTIDLTCQ